MKPVFDYLDYRAYLKDVYEERKAQTPLYSYRMMAETFGLFPSNVFRILNGDGHLPVRCHSRALDFLGLTGRSAEYFLLIIAYSRERSARSRSEILEKAMALRDVARRTLESRELEYFSHWWTSVLRSLLEVTEGKSLPAELGRWLVPRIDPEEVSRSLDLLKELGLVKRLASGRLLPAEAHLTAGGESKAKAVRGFQKQILSLASESLDTIPVALRDLSTLTLSMDDTAFREIRELIRECRRQIQKRVEESREPDRVMHLAMAFFPAALDPESRP